MLSGIISCALDQIFILAKSSAIKSRGSPFEDAESKHSKVVFAH